MTALAAIPRRVGTVVDLVGWSALTVVGCLLCWVAGTALGFGWHPVLVEGASMAPALHRGDIAMFSEPDDVAHLAPGTVARFRLPDGGVVTHRIVSRNADGTYRTRGDANPSADVAGVRPEEVLGVGRLVVPAVGLPLIWATDGRSVELAAAAGLAMAFAAVPRLRRRRAR